MEMHIFWSAVYSAFCNIVCDVYRDFSEKRDLSGKWCRYAVIGAMILADYFISVKLDGDIIHERNSNHCDWERFLCVCVSDSGG